MTTWTLIIWMGRAILQVEGYESANACEAARSGWAERIRPDKSDLTYWWECRMQIEEHKR